MWRRSLLFWGKRTEQYLGLFFLVSVLYSMVLFHSDTEEVFAGLCRGTLYYMVLFGMIIVMVFQANNSATYLPTVISMGSTRKEAAYGMQIMPLGVIAQNMALCILLAVAGYGVDGLHMDVFLVYLGVLFVSGALGQFLNSIYIRLGGRKAVYYVVLVAGMGLGCGFGLTLMVQMFFEYAPAVSLPGGTVLPVYELGGLLCALGAALYLSSFVVFRRTMRNYEVRV